MLWCPLALKFGDMILVRGPARKRHGQHHDDGLAFAVSCILQLEAARRQCSDLSRRTFGEGEKRGRLMSVDPQILTPVWSRPRLRELPLDEAEAALRFAAVEEAVLPTIPPPQADVAAQAPGIIADVARLLCGEPNRALSGENELRFGRQGSLSVNLKKGTFYDHEAKVGGGFFDFVERKTGRKGQDAIRWLIENGLLPEAGRPYPTRASASSRTSRRVVATYDYRDESGALRYQVVRYDPKTFRQRRPDGRERSNARACPDASRPLWGVSPPHSCGRGRASPGALRGLTMASRAKARQ
jgi:hypothetical protein